MMGPRLCLALSLMLLTWAGTGCASYRLGPSSGLEPGNQSITIHPFPNQTPEPGLSPILASALRRTAQADGTFTLDTRNQGDIHVNGEIIAYDRVGISFQPNDIITIRDFEVRMTATIKAVNRRNGDTILEREVVGSALVRGFNDLSNAERQALPLLADDLAQKAIDLLVDGDW